MGRPSSDKKRGVFAVDFGERIVHFYFNCVYNMVYDATVGQFTAYRSLQKKCVNKFRSGNGERMLCVGVGTGNEITHILDGNGSVDLVGIDTSERALARARRKTLKLSKDVELLNMDARRLDFPQGSFDKAVCLHVMDFVGDQELATREILRVLKKGGQFVITYPAEREGVKLGVSLLKEQFLQNINSRRFGRIFRELVAAAGASLAYIPLLFRPKQRVYSRLELEEMFYKLGVTHFQVERDGAYLDFIVSGRNQRT